MSETRSFRELMALVRAGDAQAATELVRRYEPAIRRIAHVRLRDRRLRRSFDSQDVCQSVLASFYAHVALGGVELESEDHVLKLLALMTQRKTAAKARGQRAACRDDRRTEANPDAGLAVPAPDPSPSQQVAGEELLGEFRRRLTAEELQLCELRKQGRGWDQIAATVGGTPEGLRKKLVRAINRVSRALGLSEVDHE
jgi:hypothetical protein